VCLFAIKSQYFSFSFSENEASIPAHHTRSQLATDVGLLAATRHPRCNQRPATGMFDPAIMPRLLPSAKAVQIYLGDGMETAAGQGSVASAAAARERGGD
jgi:hypothetical protein